MPRNSAAFAASVGLCGALLLLGRAAAAQSTIKRPGERPHYYFEAEPHLVAGLLDPPGFGAGSGLGAGFRGSVELLKDGFLPKLNDSVAIGFGVDYASYDGWQGPRGACEQFVSAPSGTRVCVRASGSYGNVSYFFLPLVMQWNFWLYRSWSVFGEPGVAFYVADGDVKFSPFVLYAGGRFHFSDRITLTLRVGYPTFSLGVSFLL
jgi:hypothetical protein